MNAVSRRLQKMAAQLERWGARVEVVAAHAQKAGLHASIYEHQRVDEVKALYVIARTRFDEYSAADEAGRRSLEGSLRDAWTDMAGAISSSRR